MNRLRKYGHTPESLGVSAGLIALVGGLAFALYVGPDFFKPQEAKGAALEPSDKHKAPKPSIRVRYNDDGSMDTWMPHVAEIHSFCQGGNLVDLDWNKFNRTIGHKACEDGVLTPSDFKPTPSIKVEN